VQLYEEYHTCITLVHSSITDLREIGNKVGILMEVAQILSSGDVGFSGVETTGYNKLNLGKFT
jgi:hypothetical protein